MGRSDPLHRAVGRPEADAGAVAGAAGSTIKTNWLGLDGKEIELTLKRDCSQHHDSLRTPSRPRYERRNPAGNIAYIGLHDFADEGTAADFEKDFDALRRAKAWVIDLRFNGGGSSDIGYRTFSHLIEEAALDSTWRTRQYLPASEAWGPGAAMV